MNSSWRQRELTFLLFYAIIFYIVIIHHSLQLSRDHYLKLYGLRPGWLAGRFNDVSDAQWRNFRGNLPILTIVFGLFTLIANILRAYFSFKAKGMSIIWLLISLAYLSYLHGATVIFILSIASANFILVKIFGRTKYFPLIVWLFNISFLIFNRVYEGYSFAIIGQRWAYLDKFRGSFRWHICFNFVILRMLSYGYDYHWSGHSSRVDKEKHVQQCKSCSSGRTCYLLLQEKSVQIDKFCYTTYLCYLIYAPLYIAGPIINFNAFASQIVLQIMFSIVLVLVLPCLQLDTPQKSYSPREVAWYGLRWVLGLFLMEIITHFFYYNAFAISGLWKQLSPMEVFIIGYGVLIFMWLKFFLIWRYFRFWSLVSGIETPENMPRCINNCHNLESFWKSWHASFNKWLVRYMYIPLGGSRRKFFNVWVVFTFVAIWHDLEWKLLSWAWLTCIFFIPEIVVKSAANSFQVDSIFGEFIFRELSAVAGAITITCLMVANLVGFVIGPSGISWLISGFLGEKGLPTLFGMFFTFYVGTKLMFHVSDTKLRWHQS